MLSLAERAEAYHKAFPKYPPLAYTERWIYGIFVIGNRYASPDIYGQYPPTFLKRVKSLFPDCETVVHLFSGVIHEDITIDINPLLNPSIVADAQNIPLPDESVDLIMADPPYGPEHAEKYGYPMINRKRVFQECHRILKPLGFLAWLDILLPMYRKDMWIMIGAIGIIAGTNRRCRMLTIYQRKVKSNP